jgi:hypothetical protein
VAAATESSGTPVVIARLSDGTLAPILTPSVLDRMGGSVEEFERAVLAALAAN